MAALSSCAHQKHVRIRPRADRDVTGVSFLRFVSSRVEWFYDAENRPCPPFTGRLTEFFAGWQSQDEEPVCVHDTYEHGTHNALLELRWEGTVPAGGSFDLISGGYSVGAWGIVRARGSYFGDYVTTARLELEVTSPHCHALWPRPLATAKITGALTRVAEFAGWIEVPDTRLTGCVAGEPVTVAFRLLGESNRGSVEVNGFGFSVAESSELNQMFGLKPAPKGP